MFSTGFIAATLALFAFLALMRLIPQAFNSMWQREIIKAGGSDVTSRLIPVERDEGNGSKAVTLKERYDQYLGAVEKALNDKGQWAAAAFFFALVLMWNIMSFSVDVTKEPILIVGLVAEGLIALLLGLMAWRMVIVGLAIWQLPRRFDLETQLGHPDGCGGLEPLGNLCLWNALIVSTAGIFLGGWISIGPNTTYYGLAEAYDTMFRALLFVPLLFSAIGFIVPLWSTHQVMSARKQQLLSYLDELSRTINKEARDLLISADQMELKEGQERTKRLELMRQIYEQHKKIPTWPVNINILSKFLTSQAMPVLTLVGVGEPIAKAISSALQFLSSE
jgi:hypothetical protein